MAVARRDDVWQEGLRSVHDAPEVDIHDSLDVFELCALDLAVVRDARVVEDDVDLAVVGHDRVGVIENRLTLCDVEQLGVHRCAGLGDELFRRRETVGVDVGDRQLGALLAQLHRQFAAHARARTGDDDDLVAKILHGVLLCVLMRARSGVHADEVEIRRGCSRARPVCRPPTNRELRRMQRRRTVGFACGS
ncbi:Uncharacterised protein [Mycobacteroides abscessus subsp. abscessus]|nr:Uncharacterised protein [Mycobacteroides abscessus subsp. abscessus]